jgi:hypothetical protein
LDDKTWIATIAALALGIGIVLVIYTFTKKSEETGVTYTYDDQNRLQSIEPSSSTRFVTLKPVGVKNG